MLFAATFLPLGVLFLAMAAVPGAMLMRLFWLNTGLALVAMGSGYAGLGPRVMSKRADGRLPLLTYLVYWPYFVVSEFFFRAFTVFSHEEPCHEIVPGLFHGRRLSRGEEAVFESRGIRGVLDLTCEFAETPFMREVPAYLSLPLLDAAPPTAGELKKALAWLKKNLPKGPVYVHCAMGHGRSTVVVAGHLLSAGHAAGLDEALSLIKSKRPGANLHSRQRRLLAAVFGGRRTPVPGTFL